jgi:phosphoribosyl-ATP pyrophosphohydrolase
MTTSGASPHNRDNARRFAARQEGVPRWAQVLNVAEEAGEFTGAFRRWSGNARRKGTLAEVAEELADVVIAAFVAAAHLDVDLDDAIAAKWSKIQDRPAVYGSPA